MNKDQLNLLAEIRPAAAGISVDDLANSHGERTLLFGYDNDGVTWHIYLSEGKIHRYLYTKERSQIAYSARADWSLAALLIPTRLYPEACDFAFVEILLRRAVDVKFVPFNEERYNPNAVFAGEIF